MDIHIETYDEYKNEFKKRFGKYDGLCRCAVMDCDKPAEYEGGDARCWFPVCEEHARIKEHYITHLRYLRRKIETRKIWDQEDSSLDGLLAHINKRLALVEG